MTGCKAEECSLRGKARPESGGPRSQRFFFSFFNYIEESGLTLKYF